MLVAVAVVVVVVAVAAVVVVVNINNSSNICQISINLLTNLKGRNFRELILIFC